MFLFEWPLSIHIVSFVSKILTQILVILRDDFDQMFKCLKVCLFGRNYDVNDEWPNPNLDFKCIARDIFSLSLCTVTHVRDASTSDWGTKSAKSTLKEFIVCSFLFLLLCILWHVTYRRRSIWLIECYFYKYGLFFAADMMQTNCTFFKK